MKLFLAILLCIPANSAFAQDRDDVISDFDQKEMSAAIRRAKKELDSFIKELAKPTGEDHAVKIPIKHENGTEYFWVNELTYRDGLFEGTINNDPASVKNVKLGDRRKVKKADVVDWLFMRDGKMHGNYTVRPLMKTMPKEEVEWLKSMLAEP